MPDRPNFQNPTLCINPDVVAVTNGRGYCNPKNKQLYRVEDGNCEGCRKLIGSFIQKSGRDLLPDSEKKEQEISRSFYQERIRMSARKTGRYLRR